MLTKIANQIINKRAKLHPNDPAVERYWKQLTELLSEDLENTISLLDNCDEETAGWLSEVFEDVSYNLQSVEYINCLKRLAQKYPELNLDFIIDEAVDFMEAAKENE